MPTPITDNRPLWPFSDAETRALLAVWLPKCQRAAGRYWKMTGRRFPLDELEDAAREGLYRSLRAFRRDAGIAFSTFAWTSIQRRFWCVQKRHTRQCRVGGAALILDQMLDASEDATWADLQADPGAIDPETAAVERGYHDWLWETAGAVEWGEELLYEAEGVSLRERGRMLGRSAQAVHNRRERARERVQARLQEAR